MIFKKFLNDLNIDKNDSIYLLIVLVFSLLLISIKIFGYKKIGIPDSDVIIYLCNALYYAGLNLNDIGGVGYLYSSPVICFLTGMLFRIWHVSPTPILLVTGGFEFMGSIGLYLLFKKRFDSFLSLIGAILYLTLPIVLYHMASGMLDLPAVAISIWILIFTLLAVDKNCKYYLVAFPLFIFGIFTRPTVGFMLPLMFLYFFYKYDIINIFMYALTDKNKFLKIVTSFLKSRQFKFIIVSSIISVIIVGIIVAYHYFIFNLDFLIINGVKSSMGNYSSHISWDYYYNEDSLFYIKLIPQLVLGKLNGFNIIFAYISLGMICFGFILKFVNFIKSGKNNNAGKFNFKSNKFDLILSVLLIIFFVMGCISFKINYMYSEILFFLDFLIYSSFVKRYSLNKSNGLSIIMFAWFVFYLIFISYINIKMERYFMPLFVPICYFLVYSFENILNFFKINLTDKKIGLNKNTVVKTILILLIISLMFNAFSTINHNFEKEYYDGYNDYQSTTSFLMKHDSHYMDKNITADRFHRYYSWFLNVPTQTIDTKQYPLSKFDSCGSDYIILGEKVKFENYTRIYHKGVSHLYEKIN
nr:glycosyltransferase family 39 protein [uncultured Methanobrevibacter sp.]